MRRWWLEAPPDFHARCSRQTQGLADSGRGQTGEEGDLGNRVALGGKLANDPHHPGLSTMPTSSTSSSRGVTSRLCG
jgi:hypothetical protein